MKTLPLLFCAILATLLCQSIEGADAEGQSKKIRVLIVDGFGNHDWKATTKAITSILSRDKDFAIDVSTVPKEKSAPWQQWNPPFSKYDIVIQNTNDISKKGSWPELAKKSFETYMANGGGMLAFHSANNAFPKWKEYNKMIGMGWRKKTFGPSIIVKDGKPVIIPAGEGDNTGHGKRVDTVVTRMGEHPIHQGIPRQWMAADIEIYRYARGPAENLTVLSYANEAKTGLNFPTEWVVKYGKGRVYTSTFGHYWHKLSADPPGIRCIGFQTILSRAVKWTAGAKITSAVPDTFPTKDRVSLHEFAESN